MTTQRKYIISLLGTFYLALVGFGTGILSARVLGAENRGELNQLWLLPALVVRVVGAGLNQAQVVHAGGEHSVARLQNASLALASIYSLALTAGLLVLSLYGIPSVDPEHANLQRIAILLVPLTLIGDSLLPAWLTANEYTVHGILQGLPVTLYLLFVGMFLWIDVEPLSTFVISNIIAWVATSFVRLLLAPSRASLRSTFSLIRSISRTAISISFIDLTISILQRADLLLLGFLSPFSEIGIYSVAAGFASASGLATAPIARVLLQVSSDTKSSGKERFLAGLRQYRILLLPVVAVSLVAAVVMPTVVTICLGPQFAGSASVAQVLVFAMGVSQLSQALDAALKAGRLDRISMFSSVPASLVAFGLGYIAWTIGGANRLDFLALSMGIAWIVGLIFKIFLVRIGGHATLRQLFPSNQEVRAVFQGLRVSNVSGESHRAL
jgi:O-antigen/teichoic acid export membrane protein